jgi:ABC-type nitrate/sulfonate/bicarbonate transport system substrate-binding protein
MGYQIAPSLREKKPNIRRMRRFALPLLALAALAVVACGPSTDLSVTPGQPTTVKLALDWTPNTNHTGIYVAQQLGYYRQHGLSVDLIPYGATAPEALVATGQAQFAVSFEENVAIDRAQGMPIVSVAAVIQHDTSVMAVLASSSITRPAQFVGKRFASSGDPAEQTVIDLMEVNDGATSVGYRSTVVQNADVSALVSGQFDFVWIYQGVEGVQAQDAGIALRTFSLEQYGVPDFYSPVLITSESMIQQHPDIVRAFVTATAQGYTDAVKNPSQAASLLLQGAKAQGGTLFDSQKVALDSQVWQSQHYTADAKCWGVQSLATWTGFPQLLYRAGALVDANGKSLASPPDYSAMFTDQFLPACT